MAHGVSPFPRLPQQGRPGRFVKHPGAASNRPGCVTMEVEDAALLAGEEQNQLCPCTNADTACAETKRVAKGPVPKGAGASGGGRCEALLPRSSRRGGRSAFSDKMSVGDRETRRAAPHFVHVVIEQHPLQPPLGCPASALQEARPWRAFGKVTHPISLSDTLQAGSPIHSGREQAPRDSRRRFAYLCTTQTSAV